MINNTVFGIIWCTFQLSEELLCLSQLIISMKRKNRLRYGLMKHAMLITLIKAPKNMFCCPLPFKCTCHPAPYLIINVLTTHEIKLPFQVGVMRFGRLLVEQDPSLLLQRFNTTSLETVVLQLCRQDTSASTDSEDDYKNDLGKKGMEQIEYNVEPPDSSECKKNQSLPLFTK